MKIGYLNRGFYRFMTERKLCVTLHSLRRQGTFLRPLLSNEYKTMIDMKYEEFLRYTGKVNGFFCEYKESEDAWSFEVIDDGKTIFLRKGRCETESDLGYIQVVEERIMKIADSFSRKYSPHKL